MRRAPWIAAAVAALAVTPSAWAHWGVAGHVHRSHFVVGGHAGWPLAQPVVVAPRQGVVDFNVSPPETRIFVDGTYRGTCEEFDGYPQKMYLRPGLHRIRLQAPDGRQLERTVEIGPGYELNLDLSFENSSR